MFSTPKNTAIPTYTFGSIKASVSKGEYRYGFNGMETDDDLKGEGNSLDFGARIYDSRLGRWLSVDPLADKFPNLSPFNYVSNNPNYMIDPDGKDNIIYLVYLPSSDNKLKVSDAKKIAEQTTKNFQLLGLKTTVVLVDMTKKNNRNFKPNEIDRTDGIAVLGTTQNVIDYITKDSPIFGKKLKEEWSGGADNPEMSENNKEISRIGGGKYIAIDANGIKGYGKKIGGIDISKTGALIIQHGAGHTAGINHAFKKDGGDSVIMHDADKIIKALVSPDSPYYKDYNKFISNDEKQNQDYIDTMKQRYGNNPSCNSFEAQ